MLDEFLMSNRELLLARTRRLVAEREAPLVTEFELQDGLPAFFDQLRQALRRAESNGDSDDSALLRSADHHGVALYNRGLTVAQVVHDYGSLCQVITGYAAEVHVAIPVREFQALNLCLDHAIAAAVTAFSRQRELALGAESTERLGVLAHEVRNYLNTALLALASIKKGVVGVTGSTGNILARSLTNLQTLLDRSFADVRLEAGLHTRQSVSIKEIIDELEIGATMLADASGLHLSVQSLDDSVVVEADRQLLIAAITNLLQNAFKFSPAGSTIALRSSSSATRIFIDVEDECGGLPPGKQESLLRPFVQRGQDRTGLGLGLSICVKSLQAMGGELRVRDLPAKGCVFTIDLPRQVRPATHASP